MTGYDKELAEQTKENIKNNEEYDDAMADLN